MYYQIVVEAVLPIYILLRFSILVALKNAILHPGF